MINSMCMTSVLIYHEVLISFVMRINTDKACDTWCTWCELMKRVMRSLCEWQLRELGRSRRVHLTPARFPGLLPGGHPRTPRRRDTYPEREPNSGPSPDQWWASVSDAGPALIRRWTRGLVSSRGTHASASIIKAVYVSSLEVGLFHGALW